MQVDNRWQWEQSVHPVYLAVDTTKDLLAERCKILSLAWTPDNVIVTKTFCGDCHSHMNDPAVDSPPRHVQNNPKNSRAFRWGVLQQAETGCNINSAGEITCFCHCHFRRQCWIFSAKAVSKSSSVSSWNICILRLFLINALLCVRKWPTHPPTHSESCRGSPAVFSSHMGSFWHFWVFTWGLAGGTLEVWRLSLRLLCSHIQPLRRMSGDPLEFSACLKAAFSSSSLNWSACLVSVEPSGFWRCSSNLTF